MTFCERMASKAENIPFVGVGILIACQFLAFHMVVGVPDSPRLTVKDVVENDDGLTIRLTQTDEDGNAIESRFPEDLITVAKGPTPMLV